jgi:ABC-2 type transport system permease protein
MTSVRALDDRRDDRTPPPRRPSTTRRGLVEALRTALHRSAIDGGGLVVAVAFYVVIVATLSGLWRVAVDANGGDLAGYSALALTWYIITSEAAIVSVNARHIEDVGNDIAQGTVAVELLRPASVLGIRMATEIGRGLPKVAALFVAGGMVATVVSDGPPRPATLLLVAPSLVLAITANLFAQHTVAAIAFWIRDAGSIWFLYMKAVFILGGMIIPLELLPDGLQRFAMFLPFRAMAYVPARFAAGFWEPALLLEQLIWIGVLAVGASVAFRAGERRLQVVGG